MTELHLVVDDTLFRDARARGSRPVLDTVRVPRGVSRLCSGAAPHAVVGPVPSTPGGPLLEPLEEGGERLILVTPRGVVAPRVNGRRAPRVCVVRAGDQILLEDGRILHVAVFHTPRIGAATEDQIGRICPICRTPIERGDRVFACPNDGTTLHLDSPETTARPEPLECATLPSECPGCRTTIDLSGGFHHVPRVD